jgi:uncharacterized protein YjiS (DUF1127 family)
MSTSLSNSNMVRLIPAVAGRARRPQSHSWQWLHRAVSWLDTARQRDALRALADNQHLLDDIGILRHEALDEADRPFWQ